MEARQALKTPATRALALAMLGTIRLQQGKYKESTDFLTRALALDPRLVGARTSLGNAYALQGRLDAAATSLREVLRVDPTNFNARFGLAKLEAALHHYTPSLKIAGPITDTLRHSDEGILLLAMDYASLGKKTELKSLVHDWQMLPTTSAESAINFAAILSGSGMAQEAQHILQAEEQRAAEHPSSDAALTLGKGYLSLGVLDRGEQDINLALSLDPACAVCEQMLAEIAERQGNTEKALAYLVAAKKHAPDDPEILFEFGKICLQRNLLEDAVPALTKAVALKPDQDSYVYVLASANVAQGNLPKAKSLFARLLRKRPHDAVLNYAIGAVNYMQGDYDEAESSLKKSLRAEPKQVAAAYYLALTYDGVGQEDQAVTIFRDLLRSHPEHAPSYVKLGSILVREHQYDEAREDLKRAVSLDPKSVQAHYQLGLLLHRLGKTVESEHEFAESRRLEKERSSQTELHLRLLLPD